MLGAGKVGSLIACLLSDTGDYQLYVGDSDEDVVRRTQELSSDHLSVHSLDAMNRAALAHFLESHPVDAVISCLPYYCNFTVAEIALQVPAALLRSDRRCRSGALHSKNQSGGRYGIRSSVRPGARLHQHHCQ